MRAFFRGSKPYSMLFLTFGSVSGFCLRSNPCNIPGYPANISIILTFISKTKMVRVIGNGSGSLFFSSDGSGSDLFLKAGSDFLFEIISGSGSTPPGTLVFTTRHKRRIALILLSHYSRGKIFFRIPGPRVNARVSEKFFVPFGIV